MGKNYHRKYCGGITSAVLQNGAKTAKFWLFENEPVKNFENQLRFDQDMTMSLVPPFFGRNTMYKQSSMIGFCAVVGGVIPVPGVGQNKY